MHPVKFDYIELEKTQKTLESAIHCGCVCHHVEAPLKEIKQCCVASCQTVKQLQEQIKKIYVSIRDKENG